MAKAIGRILERIDAAARRSGRTGKDITLVAVTKTHSVAEVVSLKDHGIANIGESRVQELTTKYDAMHGLFTVHFIGHLQTNKAKQAVRMADMIQSVDSVRLAQCIDAECVKLGKTMNALIEVNTSGEDAKSGVRPENAIAAIREMALLQNITIQGLMTMGPLTDDATRIRSCFKILAALKTDCARVIGIALPELSMGMSDDFEIAIEEGATMVRIGRALFAEAS